MRSSEIRKKALELVGNQYREEIPFEKLSPTFMDKVKDEGKNPNAFVVVSYSSESENSGYELIMDCPVCHTKTITSESIVECPHCGASVTEVIGENACSGYTPRSHFDLRFTSKLFSSKSVLWITSIEGIVVFYDISLVIKNNKTISAREFNGYPPDEYFVALRDSDPYSVIVAKIIYWNPSSGKLSRVTDNGISSSATDNIAFKDADLIWVDPEAKEIIKTHTNIPLGSSSVSEINRFLSTLSKEIKDSKSKAVGKRSSKENEYNKIAAKTFSEIKIPNIKDSRIANKCFYPHLMILKTIGTNNSGIIYCPECEKYKLVEVPTDKINPIMGWGENSINISCPECGSQIPVKRALRSTTAQYRASFTKWDLVDSTPVITQFDVITCIEFIANEGSDAVVKESKTIRKCGNRIVLFPKKYYYLSDVELGDHTFSSDRVEACRNKSTSYAKVGYAMLPGNLSYSTPEEVRNVIENSFLAHKGVEESFGISRYPTIKDIKLYNIGDGLTGYISNVIEHPCIEKLLKAGLTNLTKDIITNGSYPELDTEGATLSEILKVPKSRIKDIREYDLHESQFIGYRLLLEQDPQLNYADFSWALQMYNQIYSSHPLTRILSFKIDGKAVISLKKLREYIERTYYNQCIPYSESLRIWNDYLYMMRDLKMTGETIKKELFPSSLKKAHDVLTFAYNNISKEANAEKFAECIKNALKLEYSFGDYIVKAPTSPEDLIQEGIALNHSVASHIESVADKKELILFIREKANPDKAFFTVQVDKNIISEVSGQSNHPVNDARLKEFIEKWAERKHLKISY